MPLVDVAIGPVQERVQRWHNLSLASHQLSRCGLWCASSSKWMLAAWADSPQCFPDGSIVMCIIYPPYLYEVKNPVLDESKTLQPCHRGSPSTLPHHVRLQGKTWLPSARGCHLHRDPPHDFAACIKSNPLTIRPIHTPTLLRSVSLSMTIVVGHVTMAAHFHEEMCLKPRLLAPTENRSHTKHDSTLLLWGQLLGHVADHLQLWCCRCCCAAQSISCRT